MLQEELLDGLSLCCEVTPMGKDYALSVYGGERPHIGSVVMAIARPSLTGESLSATSSVLNSVGHKDEVIARLFAEAVAKAKNCTAVCTCGIHVDNISSEQMEAVLRASDQLLKRVLNRISE